MACRRRPRSRLSHIVVAPHRRAPRAGAPQASRSSRRGGRPPSRPDPTVAPPETPRPTARPTARHPTDRRGRPRDRLLPDRMSLSPRPAPPERRARETAPRALLRRDLWLWSCFVRKGGAGDRGRPRARLPRSNIAVTPTARLPTDHCARPRAPPPPIEHRCHPHRAPPDRPLRPTTRPAPRSDIAVTPTATLPTDHAPDRAEGLLRRALWLWSCFVRKGGRCP